MTSNIEGATTDVATDLAALRRDIVHLTEALRGLLEQQRLTAGARLSDMADGARDKIVHATGDAQKSARAAGDEIVACIERSPLTAILIALGLGLFIGAIGKSRG